MDVDAELKRITKFLDAAAPGWREEATWPAVFRDRERPQGARLPDALAGGAREEKQLYVDEDQTNKDRLALGLDKTDFAGKPISGAAALQANRDLDDETRREQETAKAERDAAARERGPLKAADQYANPPGGAMKQPAEGELAPRAAPPGGAGGGKPAVEQTEQAGKGSAHNVKKP